MPATNPFQLGDKVVAYLRHSPGDLQTIASQEAYVRQWCADQSLVLARVYCDGAKSGTTVAGRDRFLAMNDNLQGGDDIRGVVLWSFSRFAREVNAAEYYKSQLRLHGYIVHSLSDDIPPGDFGPVVEAFIHWKDGQLSKEISRQAKRGLHWLAQQGLQRGRLSPARLPQERAR